MTGLFERARYIAVHHYACNGHVLNGHVQARQLLPVYASGFNGGLSPNAISGRNCWCIVTGYLLYP